MKNVRKIISVMLSLAMILTALPVAFAAGTNAGLPLQTFSDLSESHVFPTSANSGWLYQGTSAFAEISSDGNNNYVKISNKKSTAEFINKFTAMDSSVDTVEVSFQIKFADKNSEKQIRLRSSADKDIALTFAADGKVKAGKAVIADLIYETDTWYDVKIAYAYKTATIAAKISDGNLSYNAIAVGQNTDAARNCINRIDFYSASTGDDNKTTEFCVDDISVMARSEFVPQYAQSFDNITALNDNSVENYKYYNEGWYMQNASGALANAESIDGRKALRLTTDGTTHFEVVKNFISKAFVRYEFDFRCDTTNEIRLCVGGVDNAGTSTVKGGNFALKFKDGKIYDSQSKEICFFNLNTWHRAALQFDFSAGTYSAKLVNLSNNTLLATKTDATIPAGTVDITTVKYYFPQKSGTMYIDNVVYGGVQSFAINPVDVLTVDAARGIDMLFNRGVDPSASVIQINDAGESYTLDANDLCTLNIGYLRENTSYVITYEVADMYGDKLQGTLQFATGDRGYGFTQLALSESEVKPGEISALVTGRLHKDDEAKLIIALYSKSGSLCLEKIDIVNIPVSVDDKTYTASLDIPDDGGEYCVKAFIWDGSEPLLTSEDI